MTLLPEPIHKRLADEFKLAASRVAEADGIKAKLYYFSVFYGETGRQLNLHWDNSLALLNIVVQQACAQIANPATLPPGAGFAPDGIPEGFLEALDEVSNELAEAFAEAEVDLTRLYAALARTAALSYVRTGNGAYLHQKGMIAL